MRYEEYDSLILGKEDSICYITDYETYEVIHLTQGAMRLYGLKSPEEYQGQKCYKLLQDLDEPCPFCTNSMLQLDEKYHWEHYNEKLQRWMSIEDTLVLIDGCLCRLEHARDITDQKQKMQRLSDQLTLEQVLVKCIQTLASVDDYNLAFHSFLEQLGRFYRANRAYIFEFDYEEQVANNTYEWCAPTVRAEIEVLQGIPLAYITGWLKKFEETGEFFITSLNNDIDQNSEEYRILANQGIESLLAAPLFEEGRIIGFIGVDDPTNSTDDLTLLRASSNFVVEELKKRRLISKLAYASYTDILTGVSNRNRYMEILKGYETQPPRSLGVIFADVNGMKAVNDTYGHKYGDKVLIRVAEILRQVDSPHVFRIGGDEFVVLFENIEKEGFQQNVVALKQWLEQDEDCDVSLGCIWKQGEMDVNNQIIKADELMYAEKQSYYKDVLSNGKRARVGMANEVIQEIAENRFVVFYQPQINIKSGDIIGAEALVRKKGIGNTLIPPDRFIPYYEIEGVIRHVDMFVLEEVCKTMQRWREQQIFINISVNFSRITLMEPNIVSDILEICNRYKIDPKYLTIEVTESISRIESEQLRELIDTLLKDGFTITLDDYGSKYSNLAILNEINFHTVKIDKSLVDQLEANKNSQIIMKNTIRMCQELNRTHTLAEGIETEGQMNLLSDYECEYGQGYFFSKPVSLERFNEILKQSER